jgi:hypothetical protein
MANERNEERCLVTNFRDRKGGTQMARLPQTECNSKLDLDKNHPVIPPVVSFYIQQWAMR